MGIGKGLRQVSHDLVESRTGALLVGIHGFTGQERHFPALRFKSLIRFW